MIRVAGNATDNGSDNLPTFTILSYNCLASNLASAKMFPRSDPEHLKFSYRSPLLEQEFRKLNADIVCFQEIVVDDFHTWLVPFMLSLGYAQGLLATSHESKMGEVTFFKKDKFILVEYHVLDYYDRAQAISSSLADECSGLLCILEVVDDAHKQKICVANTHLAHGFEVPEIQLFQLKTLLSEVKRVAPSLPFVLVGDFNSSSLSAPVHYIRYGCISQTSPFFKRLLDKMKSIFNGDEQKATDYLTEKHQFPDEKLMSAYNKQTFEMIFTVYNALIGCSSIDYVWFARDRMRPIELLDALAKDSGHIKLRNYTLPDAEHPSDHLPIMARFQLQSPTS